MSNYGTPEEIIDELRAENAKLREELDTVKRAKANNDKHLDHYYAEVRQLREQRDCLVGFVKECEGYVLTSYYQQRVGAILAEIEGEKK